MKYQKFRSPILFLNSLKMILTEQIFFLKSGQIAGSICKFNVF